MMPEECQHRFHEAIIEPAISTASPILVKQCKKCLIYIYEPLPGKHGESIYARSTAQQLDLPYGRRAEDNIGGETV